MRSVVLICGAIPPDFSGAGMRIMTQSKYLAGLGYRVKIITQTKNPLAIEGITIKRVLSVNSKSDLIKILLFPIFLFQIFININKQDESICCVSGATSILTIAGIIAGKLKSKRIIVGTTLMNADDPEYVKKSSFGALRFYALKKADIYLSISPELYESHLRTGLEKEKCFMIPNSVDTDKFCPLIISEKEELRKKYGHKPTDLVILSVGAIIKRKGIFDMVKVVGEIIEKGALNVKYLHIGPTDTIDIDENYVKEIFNYVNEKGLNSNIIFLGRSNEVEKYMKMTDIFLFNSDKEGMPNVVIEALASGNIVICKIIKQVTDYIIQNNIAGYLYENPEEMKRILEGVLENIKENNEAISILKLAARESILERFSQEVIINEYIKLYFPEDTELNSSDKREIVSS